MAMVIPRSFSSGALSIWSKGTKATFGFTVCSALVMAAVRVVFPWSMCPMVPMFMCSFVRSNFALAMERLLPCRLPRRRPPRHPAHDLLRDGRRNRLVAGELHGVGRPALARRPEGRGIAEHLGQGD